MWSAKQFLKRLKINAFSFAFTFALSLMISGLYPTARNLARWQAQYQLCQAAARGQTGRLSLLLALGSNPNGPNPIYSPLHFAARYGQNETARLLLDAGADVNKKGNWEQTALMEAVNTEHLETVRLLLTRGANINEVDTHQGTALWQATRLRNAKLIQLLMSHGGPSCTDAERALTAAVETGDEETARALLQGGVDPRGLTATHQLIPLTRYAAQNGQPQLAELLKAAGAREGSKPSRQ